MMGTQLTGIIPGVSISAVGHEGLSVLIDGEAASLAVVNSAGKVVASGPDVAREARSVSVNCYREFLKGSGHLRVHSRPIAKDGP